MIATKPLETHWEWMVSPAWNRLHYIADDTVRDGYDDTGERQPGTAACGLTSEWSVPGFMSRLGLPRCAHCCRALGIPRGDGTPLNEAWEAHK